MIYADYNATAPLRPEAREAMFEVYALGPLNPSSVHGSGRKARSLVESARVAVGGAVGSRAEDVVFTSGGTEACALAILGVASALENKCTFLVSAIEHEAVTKAAAITGCPIETIYVGGDGRADLGNIGERLKSWDHDAKGTPIACLMVANNETGILQPISELAALIHAADGLIIADGVQALGKVPVSVAMLGVDYLAMSSHKVGGPQGVGALWHRPGAPLKAVQYGGGQEKGLRSGTENVAGIAGFGAALTKSVDDLNLYAALAGSRDAMEARLVSEAGVIVLGKDSPRLAGTSCFAKPGFAAETQVMAMDLAGVCISAGSACSSGKVKRSTVLMAMGHDDEAAESAIRVSFGWDTQPTDFQGVADAWLKAAALKL